MIYFSLPDPQLQYHLHTHPYIPMLIQAGFEVESLDAWDHDLGNLDNLILIGRIEKTHRHPDADRLTYHEVQTGSHLLHIVCGAPNARNGIIVPVALPGARLPSGLLIEERKIRGLSSSGMMCAAQELGYPLDEKKGLWELPCDAPIGIPLAHWMRWRNSRRLTLSITPNRGDMLSNRGFQRELETILNVQSALDVHLNHAQATDLWPNSQPEPECLNFDFPALRPYHEHLHTKNPASDHVYIDPETHCCAYFGAYIRIPVDTPSLQTPLWLREYLRRQGQPCVHLIVDILNALMLEYGQPMHAFDAEKLSFPLSVRMAKQNESITILDGRTLNLNPDTCVIADTHGPCAIAGVMGGLHSSITTDTRLIWLESAHFPPHRIANQARQYGIESAAAYRFERGVDPSIVTQAGLTAIELIKQWIPSAQVEWTIDQSIDTQNTLKKEPCLLSLDALAQSLGFQIPQPTIETIFSAMHIEWKWIPQARSYQLVPPSYRFDLKEPCDWIEEIARLYGYDHIPEQPLTVSVRPSSDSSWNQITHKASQTLVHQGYQEVMSYGFVASALHQIFGISHAVDLQNPINDRTHLRTCLMPGLVEHLVYQIRRHHHDLKLFEIGSCFLPIDSKNSSCPIQEKTSIAGVSCGLHWPLQWGCSSRKIDFFDIKHDILCIARSWNLDIESLKIDAENLPDYWHPHQAARLLYHDECIGFFGALHPKIAQYFDISDKLYGFEYHTLPQSCSTQPRSVDLTCIQTCMIRRDFSMIAPQMPMETLRKKLWHYAGEGVTDIVLFDIYQGGTIPNHQQSVTFSVTWQVPHGTDADALYQRITDHIGDWMRSHKDS